MKETGTDQYVMIYDRTDFQRRNFDVDMMKVRKYQDLSRIEISRDWKIFSRKTWWNLHCQT